MIASAQWDGYTVCSVISGIIMIVAALVPGVAKGRDRMWYFVGGVAVGGYGIYVANQTSGTFGFPVQIFIIPIVAALYLLVQLYQVLTKAGKGAAGTSTPSPRPSTPPGRPQSPSPAPRTALSMAPPPAPAPTSPPQWQADPHKRHELRYWDGTRWTEHVSNAGVVAIDVVR